MAQVQDAVTRARVKQEKQAQKRDEFNKKLAETVRKDKTNLPAIAEKSGDQTSIVPTLPVKQEAKSGDQKSAPPASKPTSGDQKSVPEVKAKKVKKTSNTVIEWKKLKNFPPEAIISKIATGNPKRRDAARRFGFYKDGMTVADYLKVTKDNNITNALANADIRWDYAAGFIMVTDKK